MLAKEKEEGQQAAGAARLVMEGARLVVEGRIEVWQMVVKVAKLGSVEVVAAELIAPGCLQSTAWRGAGEVVVVWVEEAVLVAWAAWCDHAYLCALSHACPPMPLPLPAWPKLVAAFPAAASGVVASAAVASAAASVAAAYAAVAFVVAAFVEGNCKGTEGSWLRQRALDHWVQMCEPRCKLYAHSDELSYLMPP